MILVTGGLGMIGAHTAAALVDLGEEVVVTAHRRRDVPSFLAGRVAVEAVDVADRDAFLALGERYDIGGIVHLAGSIPEPDPIPYFRRDTAALLMALEAARSWEVARFAVAGSISSYEGRDERPWTEDLALPLAVPPHPIAAFKKAVEPLTLFALAGTGVQPVILRIGSTWGPLMDPESPFNPVPSTVSAVLRGERPRALPAGGGDFGYAPDSGRAIALLMTAPSLAHAAYNVSSGVPFDARELVDALNAALPGSGIELAAGESSGAAPYLDIGRLRAETGFEPVFDIAAAVAHYVDWRRGNPR
ncbi:Nucleoside-diphosphate-sugar epimerase [Microbacterium sp. 8M]|uniref:NAD-dependent epimerase/dehydratase family protein n=1 Tax=Microbacterium sp. 8M TaxID=2653153 RepID=UPI0012F051DE|nr:NAD(P)-dependent oxidoreductase [Microbacterium sp. 8M]VXB39952.1 Nucleoside-diphosphate-sugar epimerase [Microbacterium sp. 8M]